MIPFSPPRIDEKVINEVSEALRSGWITTGPRTKKFEKEISAYTGAKTTVCVSSWTTGMEVVLRWWGIGPGDEVILPCYTYCASANIIVHTGAKVVMVDINEGDFNLNLQKVKEAITPRTKAIMGVDISGFPCDYDELFALVEETPIKHMFTPANSLQENLGRILILSDAAHSFGATYKNKVSGSIADISAFSFHAVKNLTTAEGGALTFNLPEAFDHELIYKRFCSLILHGQSKDALAKTQKGNWKYDVEDPGYKCNMTDLQAAIGLIELERYGENLEKRKQIFEAYNNAFKVKSWAILPAYKNANKETSYHLYLLRIKNITEDQRDQIIQHIFDFDVSVNVHFQPLPLLTAYKKRGYAMADYPQAYKMYASEITLPVYFDLTDDQQNKVVNSVIQSVEKVIGSS
ncbi:MAG: DegT/DnrJ/EryC1/StrS family aminotransferase [Lishizhenia sp.]